jgi:hypothetical protein
MGMNVTSFRCITFRHSLFAFRHFGIAKLHKPGGVYNFAV